MVEAATLQLHVAVRGFPFLSDFLPFWTDVDIFDFGGPMDFAFYLTGGASGLHITTVHNATSGSNVSINVSDCWDMQHDTDYTWFVTVDDMHGANITSDEWTFHSMLSLPPIISNERPGNNSDAGVGTWLRVDVDDPDEDTINVSFYLRENLTSGFDLTLLDTIYDGDTYYEISGDDNYIYLANRGGLYAYSFDGSDLTLLDTQDDGGDYRAVWSDGSYIYVANLGEGIRAYSFNGTDFTLLDTQDDGGNYYNVWGDGTYIYTAVWDSGLYAYSFDGSDLTLLDTQDDGNYYGDIWGDGTYVYVANYESGIRAYTFGGTDFTLLDTQDDGGEYYSVWGDGIYVYATYGEDGEGIRAYSFNGTDFTLLDDKDDGSDAYQGIWGDGTYIYTACMSEGLRAYSFNGTDLTLLETQDDGGEAYYGIWTDDTYVFTACYDDGLRAYAIETIITTDSLIKTVQVESGETASCPLYIEHPLELDADYFWYVIASDEYNNVTSPTWNFHTSPPTVLNLDTGEEYHYIQHAIDDPDTLDGHTLILNNKIYYENVIIDKELTITGVDKDRVIIHGGDNKISTINITANNITLFNITVKGGRGGGVAGIELHSNNNVITDCNITENDFGLLVNSNVDVYYNNFFNNLFGNVYDTGSSSYTYNYWDTFDESFEGAYDNNGDGIADDQYNIPGGDNQELYPLMQPWNGTLPPSVGDTTPPDITSIQGTPDPQVVGGYVNITCDVTDNVAVSVVKVNIAGPGGFIPVNVTMDGSYYYNAVYSIPGTYTYFIWASDTIGNAKTSAAYTFVIEDTTPPDITNIQDTPDPQVVGGYVNITCDVTDNVAVSAVKVNIAGPSGFTQMNVTMDGSYYYNAVYSIPGTYTYSIWANDTINNRNTSLDYTFYIVSTNVVWVDDDFYPSTPGWGYDHFDNIQDGIDTVAENGMVYVFNGTYYESAVVNKTINLIGENKVNTIIDSDGVGFVVDITADWANISGFTIQNGTAGLHITSDNNTISGSIISNNGIGMHINYSNNNTILENSFFNNGLFVISHDWSQPPHQNTVSNNTVNGKPLVYLEGESDTVIDEAGQVILIQCDNITILSQELSNAGVGIQLFDTDDCHISGNTIGSNKYYGIHLMFSSNNTILGNYISNNAYGIWLDSSSDYSLLYHNSFINNIQNAYDEGNNTWDNGYPSAGNYWDNYTGVDTSHGPFHEITGSDGIGDIPYNISGDTNQDKYPLMDPWESASQVTITVVEALPSIQEFNGSVNITCKIIGDVMEIDEIYLNITYPNDSIDNISITQNKTYITFYCHKNYSQNGTYNYFIWANDTSGTATTSSMSHFWICPLIITETLSSGENTINVTAEMDTNLDVNTTQSTNITLAEYAENPYPEATRPPDTLDKYINIDIENETSVIWPINITIYYTQEDLDNANLSEDDLVGIFYWNETTETWKFYNETGVNTTDTNGFAGYLWANAYHLTSIAACGDITPPEITSIGAIPDSQEIGGYVNVTCTVLDNVDVSMVKVNITYPSSTLNTTMTNVPDTNDYYFYTSYSILGTYTYSIWAIDTSDNAKISAAYTFVIEDSTPPDITSIQDTPDPQVVGGYVNITCDVTDNVAVSAVKVNIAGPGGFTQVNVTMDGSYYYNTSYMKPGSYMYYIWVIDTSGNTMISTTHSFIIEDTTSPIISNIQDTPDPQVVDGAVNISCEVADEVAVSSVKVSISGPSGYLPITIAMQGSYYYNASYTTPGVYSYSIIAIDTSSNEIISSTHSFTIEDITPPEFINIQDTPDPQVVGGSVNISCEITDNVAISSATISIAGPSSVFTALQIASDESYYYNTIYSLPGIYTYSIWIVDTSGNLNKSENFTFTIEDVVPPEIINIQDSPDPQIVDGYVNITCNIVDDVAISSVKVAIVGPSGFTPINVSMDGNYYYNAFYTFPGTYTYSIWTVDTSNNINTSAEYTFSIISTDMVWIDDDYYETGYNDGHTWGFTAFDNIQDGIDITADNDMVYVYNGTYQENIHINHPITLIGENSNTTIIDGGGTSGDVVYINADLVTIVGFTIKNSGNTNWLDAGIYVYSNNNKILGNKIINSNCGIRFSFSSNNYISGNTITNNNEIGMHLDYTDNSIITNNLIANNSNIGIYNWGGNSNEYSYNTILNNPGNGIQIRDSGQTGSNWIHNNTILGNGFTTTTGETAGIFIWGSLSKNNIIENNLCKDNKNGIQFRGFGTKNNIVRRNIISNNDVNGIRYTSAAGPNTFYNNNFINNILHLSGTKSTDIWDDGYPTAGNYWDTYTGTDNYQGPDQTIPGSDGIGDTAYTVTGDGQDHYPLMNPWSLNDPPEADAGGPYSGNEGFQIILDASNSIDPDEDTLQYRWDFNNDGTWDTNYSIDSTAAYTWYDDHSGEIVVEVYDSNKTDNATATITVNNLAPIASIDSVVQPSIGFILPNDELDFTGSFIDPGIGDTHIIEWDFDDGTIVTGTLTPTHAYNESGLYTVTLTVTDDDSGVGTASVAIVVESPVEVLEDIIADIEDLVVPEDAEKEINKSIKELNKAVDEFNDDDTEKALGKIEKAVKHLMKAQDKGADTQDIIDDLVELVKAIVDDALEDAIETVGADNSHVIKAQENYNKSLDKIGEGKYDKGIKELKKTYKEAMKALGEWIPGSFIAGLEVSILDVQNMQQMENITQKAKKFLQDAESKLNESLAAANDDDFKKALTKIKEAVEKLEKAIDEGVDDAITVIESLLENIEDAVYQKITDAEAIVGANNTHIIEAWNKFNEAIEKWDEENYKNAIDKFKDAVEKVKKALE